LGPVEREEMRRVFNMGVGMVVVVAPSAQDRVLALLQQEMADLENTTGLPGIIGEVVSGDGKVIYE
jgi:phosphoribosylformylglycinamidine cyclo-ligase